MKETSLMIGTRYAWNIDYKGDQICLERLRIFKFVFQKPRSLLVQSDWTYGFEQRRFQIKVTVLGY